MKPRALAETIISTFVGDIAHNNLCTFCHRQNIIFSDIFLWSWHYSLLFWRCRCFSVIVVLAFGGCALFWLILESSLHFPSCVYVLVGDFDISCSSFISLARFVNIHRGINQWDFVQSIMQC